MSVGVSIKNPIREKQRPWKELIPELVDFGDCQAACTHDILQRAVNWDIIK